MTREEYEELRDELLVLTTEISESLNYRKFMYRLKNLTMEKIMRKLKVKTRKYAVIWKGPGHMLVQNAQSAEGKRQSIDDGVGGLTMHSSNGS